MKEKRGNLMKELRQLAESTNVEAELQDVDLFKLLTVFEKVLKRQDEEKNKPVHQVIQYPYTIEGQKQYILEQIGSKPRVAFIELFENTPTRIALIFNFLSILELLANGFINIQQGEGFNNFWVMRHEEVSSEIPSDVPSEG